jgi:hypothetical protein
MRLEDALPSLPPLVAVVTIFLGPQLERNTWTFRARYTLDASGGLAWLPPDDDFIEPMRLHTLWRNLAPYHSDRGFKIAREVFRRTAALARSRGATPLFVLFSWGPPRPIEAHKEAWLYRELFEEQGLQAIVVDVEKFIEGDGHPTAAEAARIGEAIAQALPKPAATP